MSRRAGLSRIALWGVLALGLTVMWVQFGASAATTMLTILSGGAALTEALTAWRWRAAQGSSSTPDQLGEAERALAREVRNEWEAEAARRLIQDDGELVVHWRAGRETGELSEIVRDFAEDPRRLVVVGEPGSGKTGMSMLLALELLRRPAPERVPVILQASSWNPAENLHSWIIRTLAERYPFLGNEGRYGPTAVRELVRQHRILSILDALDEMAEEHRAKALDAVVQDSTAQHPWVITCRTTEFMTANATGVIRDAQVVRLLPVGADDAADYLLDAAADNSVGRWEPVLAELSAGGDRPVVAALRTPLMLFLARISYAPPSTDPRELLTFTDPRQVEQHLLDTFPRRAFITRPPSPLHENPRGDRGWDPADAERWLAYLAKHSGREIAWWQLSRLVPRPVFVVRGALVGAAGCMPLGWLLFGLFGRPVLGIVIGLAVGAISSASLSLMPSEPPKRFVPRLLRRQDLGRDLSFGLIGAVVGGIAVGLIFGALHGVVVGLVFGFTFGTVRRFTEPTEPSEAVTPLAVLRADRSAVMYAGILGAIVGACVGAALGGVIGTDTRGLVLEFEQPMLLGLLGAVGAVIGAGGLGMVVRATSAWGRFVTTRVWFAYRGATPLRLMSFLDDAHRLGVLRQVGPYYQFRHALLQDRLALKS
jgi:NACHT domain